MKKYKSILRVGSEETDFLNSEMFIVAFEKLDGGNVSFKKENGLLKLYSRVVELMPHEGFRGFRQWAEDNIDLSKLVEGKQYYGEWLVPHKIKYNVENINSFYLYDVLGTDGFYEGINSVRDVSKILSINMAPVFYEGLFIDYAHLSSFVGKSELGLTGEGIVIKAYDYRDRRGKQVFLKMVTDEFKEAKRTRIRKESETVDFLNEFVNDVLTEARVSKQLHKYIDDGLLDENFSSKDIGKILQILGISMFEDIMKEEAYQIEKYLKKKIGKKVPNVLIEVMKKEDRM